MTEPEECPLCKTLSGDNVVRFFGEDGYQEEDFVCGVCDTEWTQISVMVEKKITKDGRETS